MLSSTSEATINALQTVFAIEGLPQTIVSDNGTPFVSREFQDFCRRNSINHLTSAPFHPASNGEAERTVRTFKSALIKNLESSPNQEMALLTYLSTYRATPDNSGKSPAEYLHGRPHRTLLSAMQPGDIKPNERETLHTKFEMGQPIFARQYLKKEKWIEGTIIKPQGRRMYLIETAFGTWRRHQNQLRKRTIATKGENGYGYEESVIVGHNQQSSREEQEKSTRSRGQLQSPPGTSHSYVAISPADELVTREPQPHLWTDLESQQEQQNNESEDRLGATLAAARRSKRIRCPPVRFNP